MLVPCVLPLVLGLATPGQAAQAPRPLTPDTPVEGTLTNGESQTYRIALSAGEVVRFRLAPRAIDGATPRGRVAAKRF